MLRCVKCATNGAQRGRRLSADARGARYQYSGVGSDDPNRVSATIYRGWQEGHFTLLVCLEQLDELRATLRKPAIAARVKPYKSGRLVNQLKELAERVGSLPRVKRSPDPTDDFLLALSEVGKADYLVTGDHSGLLLLKRHHATRIVAAREFADILKRTGRPN